MKTKLLTALLLGSSVLGFAGVASAADATLNIESWRGDDLAIWQEKIIPAFEAKNPGIKVVFAPTAPTEYNAALNAKLAAGSAGDLITCRPFDKSLELFNKGHLADLTDLPGMENFSASPSPPGARTMAPPSACRWLRSSTASSTTRMPSRSSASRFRQRKRILRRSRQDQGRRHLHSDGHGHEGPLGSRDHGLPEHRPDLLEGRGRPQGADQGRAEADRRRLGRALPCSRQVEGLPRRRFRSPDLSGQPEPVHARPRCHLSGRLVGNRPVQHPGTVQDGRLPAAGEECRRHLLHLGPQRYRRRPQRQEQANAGSSQEAS
jgi:hypothetical protein